MSPLPKILFQNFLCAFACPACPVAQEDGTGVAPEDRTGARGHFIILWTSPRAPLQLNDKFEDNTVLYLEPYTQCIVFVQESMELNNTHSIPFTRQLSHPALLTFSLSYLLTFSP
jgi:hypothetical protein